jgi:hypothetical protein
MTYRIARNGQIYGPYSLIEVQRYLASGRILPTDLTQSDSMQEWLPIEQLFPTTPSPAVPHPGGLPKLFPDPPNLPWVIALIIGIFTLGFFFQIWDIVESAWMRRVDRSSTALYLYLAEGIVYLIKLPLTFHTIAYNLGYGLPVEAGHSAILTLLGLILFLLSRFVFRNELLRHFNGPEPIGLRLNWFLTLLFGGLYFQYHFNRINELKRTLRISVPAV